MNNLKVAAYFQKNTEIMTAANPTPRTFSSTQSTPLIRIFALMMGILHIPTLIAGFLGTAISILVFPILPVTLTLFICAIILYQKYWAIYRDKLVAWEVEAVWKRSLYFSAFLLIPAIFLSINMNTIWSWAIVGFILVSIFLEKSALNELERTA